MRHQGHERRSAFVALWAFALAFGWIEGSVVVYLRDIYTHQLLAPSTADFAGLPATLVSIPSRLLAVEVAREAATMILLAAVAWLGAREPAARIGAFLMAFGVWDLSYYGTLHVVLGWPETLRVWDILFLIPLPWVAPVWAPALVAVLFVAAGAWLFWTPDRDRRVGWRDAGVFTAAALLTIGAFLAEWRTAVEHREPESFPAWLFWAGVALGVVWFLRREFEASDRRSSRPAPVFRHRQIQG